MKKLYLALVAVFTWGAAWAVNYTWKSAVSGDWENPANWSGGDGTDYPDDVGDTAAFPGGSYTVTLAGDLSIGSFGDFASADVVFELGGHTLTLSPTADKSIYNGYTSALCPTPYKAPTFRNGTVTFTGSKGFNLGLNGNANGGGFTLDGATSNLSVPKTYFYGPPRIILKNGAVWNVRPAYLYQYNQKASASATHGFVLVTGMGTKLDQSNGSADLSTCFNFTEGGLFVQDGGEADFVHASIGGTDRVGEHQNFSTNSFIEVDNATVSVSKTLTLGGYYQYGFTEHDKQFGPTLRVKGAHPSVTVAEQLYVYDGVAAKFEYHVPDAGWAAAPIQVKKLTVASRNADYTYSGTTTNLVYAFNWMAKHPQETVTLIELEEANPTALADFAAHAVVADYDEDVFTSEPSVTVGGDGKKLLLTAPDGVREEAVKPQFTVVRDFVSATEESVTARFATFGTGCDALTTAKVELFDNAAFSGDPVATETFDVATMTDPEGSYAKTLTGLSSRTVYYVRVTVENARGFSADATADFSTAGTAETFTWAGGRGLWEDAANWQSAVSYPTAGDKVKPTADAQIVLNSDERCAALTVTGVANAQPVFDLNGHTLTFPADSSTQLVGSYATKEDLEPIVPTLTFKNGTVGSGLLINPQNGARPGTGSLALDNAAYTGKLFYQKQPRHGFRFFFQNGSKVKLNSDVNDFGWATDISAYGFLCVRNPGTTFATEYDNVGKSSFRVEGFHNGLYVLDQAEATITMSLTIGYRDASTNSFVEVDDATLTPKYALAFGAMNSWGKWQEGYHVMEPTLRIKGRRAQVKVGTDIRMTDGVAARICFSVPTNGFAATPLTANTLTFVERGEGNPDNGPAQVVIDAREWKRANPRAVQELVRLTTANAGGLARLIRGAKISGRGCTLAVSADGKSVVLTAPEEQGLMLIVK